ncbi:MAG: serine hydrolase [Gemmatimonadota bacterium]
MKGERRSCPVRAGSIRHWVAICLAASVVACGGDGATGPPPPEPVPTSIAISGGTDTLRSFGEQTTLMAQVLDASGTPISGLIVTWSSSSPSVVSVGSGGVVLAVTNGSSDVMATSGTVNASVTIVSKQAIGSISISGADTVFNPGVRTRFSASAVDPGGSLFVRAPLVWSSSDPSVATVDANGLVLPLAAGTTGISASVDGSETTSDLTVVPLIDLEIAASLAESFQWTLEDIALPASVMGASASIRFPNGDVWIGVFGDSDETRRFRPEMMTPIGSTQKTFISATILKLIEQGSLALEDTIGAWIAPHPNIDGSITIRQLLQNTSGLFSYNSNPQWLTDVTADLNRVWTPTELLQYVDGPTAAPGTVYKSTSTGYLLAGIVAEAITGTSVASATRSLVFGPLSLGEVFMGSFEPIGGTLATTWNGPAGGPLDNFTTTYAGNSFDTASYTVGSWVINARDLARWGEALFTDFFTPAIRAEMLTTVPDDGRIPGQVAAGVGVRKYDYLGRTQWGHSGAGLAGSSFMVWDEASGITLSVVYNQNASSHGGSHFTLIPELLRLALGQ